MAKTNAMRILEHSSIAYTTHTYPVDESDLSGEHVAQALGLPKERLFKTLVLKGAKRGYLVYCIPCHETLDLKKAAQAASEKKVEMLPMKELLPITGYVRGGCSPVGMKKPFPVWIDETASLFDTIYVSAGARGQMMELSPGSLVELLSAQVCDLTQSGLEERTPCSTTKSL